MAELSDNTPVVARNKKGQFLPGTQPPNKITSPTQAHALANARWDKKRATIAAAANEAVQRDDYRIKYGDNAYIAALAETAMIKATTPDDPKAIEAARFLLQETGLSEGKPQAAAAEAQPAVTGALVQLLRDVLTERGIVIDADILDDAPGDA